MLSTDETPAINIYVDASEAELKDATGTPNHDIRIANNKIVNSKTAAIGVQYARDAVVVDNVIENPMAARLQTIWGNVKNYDNASAIFLNAVANVQISDNSITLEDENSVPEVDLLHHTPHMRL